MMPKLHEKAMEQNRKHHRRRRPKPPLPSNPNQNQTRNEILNRNHLNPSTTSSCHQHQHLLLQAQHKNVDSSLRSPPRSSHYYFPTTCCRLMVLVTGILLSAMTQVNFAQVQHNFLLPGHNMENLRIPESQPLDSIVYQLKAVDRQNENRKFSYHMTGDTFSVDESTGEVKLIKPLDRERQPVIVVVISVFDNSDSKNDLPVESKRRTIQVEDIDDSWPQFAQHKQSVIKSSPTNQQHHYQVELSELVPLQSLVLSEVQVVDADEGPNAEIVFECRPKQSTNGACDAFSLESRRLSAGRYSVSVRTKQLLDYERVQTYRLTLVARGRRPSPLKGVPLESEASVHIHLINVQDEGPQFINAPYSLSMHEGLRPGTRLLNLIVQDGDSAPQRDLSMIVVPGPFSEYFQVTKDPEYGKIWYLETNVTLDRERPEVSETGNMFAISLLAAELDASGSPVATELELLNALREPGYSRGTLRRENVTVMVLDLPDSRPLFVQASTGRPLAGNVLEINLSEATQTGSSIPNLDLAVLDLDQGINSRFNLSLMDVQEPTTSGGLQPLASAAFALESEIIYGRAEIVINVINSSLLDYETPNFRLYKLQLVASKNSQPSLVQILELHLNIQDANDNAPEFERDQYLVEVPEGSVPGTQVATIKAHDRDSGPFGKLDYMLRGPGASKFKLVANEGKILVNDCGLLVQCLDYETQASFSLTYEARDGGGRTKNVSLIIQLVDINDHSPRFTESIYRRELISDNLSSKQNYISPQLIVRARDGDGPSQGRNNLTYRIRSSNLTSLEVEPTSGLVYLSAPLDLDNMIQAATAASGSGSRAPDSGRRLVFEAEVVAEDNGQPMQNSSAKILLHVKGNPEGAPQFKQELYLAQVRENQPVAKPFFQVQAIDPDDKDSQLRYSLGYDPNDLLAIQPATGELAFKTRIDYDDFRSEPYNITVYATDNSRPYPLKAAAVVSIQVLDVNDKPPRFEEAEYRATLVQGKTRAGDTVLRVRALDPDRSASLNYSLVVDQLQVHDRNGQQFSLDELANSTHGYLSFMSKLDRQQLVAHLRRLFHINRTTGWVELKWEPDYSFAGSITLPVRVQDLNQELPVASSTNNNNGGGEQRPQEALAVCTFFLQTHVDKSPIFAPPWSIDRRNYTISMLEELTPGFPVFSLMAKDPITSQAIDHFEKVFESDPRDYFRVERSGLVVVNKRIDYEQLEAPHRLNVSVKALSSDAFYSVAQLQVQVVDLNDNAPQFKAQNYSVTLSESATFPQEVLTLQAEDRDSADFGRVYYSLSGYSSDLFAIDATRGVVSVKRGALLDRDSEPRHSLVATASDCPPEQLNETTTTTTTTGCRKSSTFVDIQLSDENDNEPVFGGANKRGELEAVTSETVAVGQVIGQALATDLDEGPNGQVSYEIVRGPDELASKLIRIDRDGFISVAESLAGLGRSSPYRIQLRAFDHGQVSRQSFATLLLTISDVVANDGVPRFVRPRPDEIVLLSENSGPSTFVYQAQAVDPDEEANGKLMYKFIQPSDVFEIDPFTGVIKTQFRANFYLDRELVPNYTLVIVAQDLGSPPKQAHQVLVVKITDVNDNEPYFERAPDDPPLVLYVEEEIALGSLVGTVQALDKDVGANALIGYEIIDGNHNNLFRLSFEPSPEVGGSQHQNGSSGGEQLQGNNACRIYSTARLDRETRESYLLTIRASSINKMRNSFLHHQLKGAELAAGSGKSLSPHNQYNASDLTKLRVLIKLVDINDNRPVFVQQNAKSVVDSSAEIYSQLLVFKALDADSSNSEIQYSILDAFYHSDSRFQSAAALHHETSGAHYGGGAGAGSQALASMKHVFDIDPRTGILRNSVSLRPYIDGYFEVFVKADSSSGLYGRGLMDNNNNNDEPLRYSQFPTSGRRSDLPSGLSQASRCYDGEQEAGSGRARNSSVVLFAGEQENCFVAITKAVVFVTHQRETFRFVFNKTKLNDRLDEFKLRIQGALEELMFDPAQAAAASTSGSGRAQSGGGQTTTLGPTSSPRPEKLYLNTFNTDFFEREDGSLDFNTLTSCSQLVKFADDRAPTSGSGDPEAESFPPRLMNSIVPNQVINYEEVLELLKALNVSGRSTGGGGGKAQSLFSQYGLLNVERCLTDRTQHRMSSSERAAIYFACMIALVGLLLALIVSRMRKSYEKNLKLLQRSKYQYMNQYASLPPGALARPAHHLSLAALQQQQQQQAMGGFMAPPYGSHSDYDGPGYDTWQL